MSIRFKFILVVLPLLIAGLVIGGVSSQFVATNGITRVAIEFFEFKLTELEKYVEGQWSLLVENDLSTRPDMVQAAQAGIEVYARSILRNESEIIFAIDEIGSVVLSTSDGAISDPSEGFRLTEAEQQEFLSRALVDDRRFRDAEVDGQERVTMGFLFEPFNWYIVISEDRDTFYEDVRKITTQTIVLVVVGSLVMIVLLLIFIRLITRPLSIVVGAMKDIIERNDLSARVPVQFNDEIGQMSNTFNLMTQELETAYSRIKRYAFEAAVSEKKESRIRHIFQKYVPQELIDQFSASPESMLVGANRELSILFSDIRGFTTISEALKPDELVNNLNRYFQYMVDIIMNRDGIIDKYIGDAIMAFFGAPVQHENDALQSVLTGIEMMDAVERFNEEQERSGKPHFHIGVGINYGTVTVGNIGTDRKLDYTVIGDSVNVASRLEGLTKYFKQGLLIAENLQQKVAGDVLTRQVARVAVKGKTEGLAIYTAAKADSPDSLKQLWAAHDDAMNVFYSRDFSTAKKAFEALKRNNPDDYLVARMVEQCSIMIDTPPGSDWTGVEIMTEK